MKPFRTNALRDTGSLLRGLAGGTPAPYIGSWPAMIAARRSLFRWSDIDDDSQAYTFNFDGYTPYVSTQPFKMEHLPEPYARDAFEHLMLVLPDRVSGITRLLESDGVRVAPDVQSWQEIGRWIANHVEVRPLAPGETGKHLRPLWHSLTLDLALLMGEQTIALRGAKPTSWQFYADTPYHQPQGYGRDLWLLLEPLPVKATRSAPRRLLLVSLMEGVVSTALHGTSLPGDSESATSDAVRTLCEIVLAEE